VHDREVVLPSAREYLKASQGRARVPVHNMPGHMRTRLQFEIAIPGISRVRIRIDARIARL
jgi:hypothetical protein